MNFPLLQPLSDRQSELLSGGMNKGELVDKIAEKPVATKTERRGIIYPAIVRF